MGMSAWYGATDEEESIATIHRALELGIFFLDTADIYGAQPGENEAARRHGDRRPARRGRARDEVRQRLSRGRHAQHQRAARVRARGDRPVARAARRRPRRPLLPAPRRQDGADRGDGRRDGGARRRRQGAAPRPVGGVAGDDPARARGAPDHGAADASTRCGRATRRTTRCSRRCASSGSASSRTRRSAAASSPGAFRSPDDFDDGDFRKYQPRFQGENFAAQPRPRRARAGDRAPRRACTPGAARARVGAVARRRRRADPRDEAAHVPRGERRRVRGRARRRRPRADRRGVPEAARPPATATRDMSTIDALS